MPNIKEVASFWHILSDPFHNLHMSVRDQTFDSDVVGLKIINRSY